MKRWLILTVAAAASACAAPRPAADPQVTVEELRAHVEWLADDAREGRRAGTAGEKAAAEYIAREFKRAGLEPAGDNGGWYQEFEVALEPQPGKCSLTVDGRPMKGVGTLACSATGRASAQLTLTPTRGAVALILHSGTDGTALRNSLRAATEAGAVAALVGRHPNELAQGPAAEIAFASAPGAIDIPVLTLTPHDFALLQESCAAGKTVQVGVVAEVLRPTTVARNVLGRLRGSIEGDLLVVGAHFDHLGWGGEDSLAPGARAIHNGADDNASGTAVLIELAGEWSPGRQGVLFAAWSAEELGLLGSAHWVKNPTVDLARVRANVNLDMVGRVANGKITVGSAETAAGFRPALDGVQTELRARGIGLELAIAAGALPGGGGSDHMSFHQAGIPALFFFSGLHADYHKPTDDAGKLDYLSMLDVSAAVSLTLARLQEADAAALAYVKPAAPEGGAREGRRPGIWFGSIPDYAAAPEGGGMQIAGTSPGSPAEKAGLQAGDVIRKLGDVAITDIYSFMDALAGFKDGDTITVTVLRAGQQLTLPLTFFPRPVNEV
jgi:hypothetical protein